MPKVDGSATKRELRSSEDSDFASWLESRGSELKNRMADGRNRSVAVNAAREQVFLDDFRKIVSKFDGKYVVGRNWRPSKSSKPELVLNVNLSDLHYGAALDAREVPLAYGHVEEARRTAAIALWIADYRSLAERRNMKLVLNILGDIIQNQLHDPRDGAPLTEQFAASVHLLSQFISFVAASGYQEVVVNCTPGNHGRNTARHRERATNQKWDSIENMVYYALSKACSAIPGVSFNIPYRPFVTYKAFDHNIFATHGDTVIKPGFPNHVINVSDVRRQINEINGKLSHADRYKVFVVGHVHVSSKTKLPNGVYFLSNGCLIPTDAYAQSIGITETATCQTVFESTPTHAVGYHCDIDVHEGHDKDKSLDSIIKPFVGINLR